jgi:transglutaminase-like putative cysteine protease
MLRNVSAHMELDIKGRTDMVLVVAAATNNALNSETLSIMLDGERIEPTEIVDPHGTRLHRLIGTAGRMTIDYEAEVAGTSAPIAVTDLDPVVYLRPSRYCESDTLTPTARSEFAGLYGKDLLAAVSSWVGSKLRYVPGSSLPTDGAEQTLLARRGVCRDYAHLSIALLRALDVPARMVAVYAPGLDPMDFHAVCEAYVDGAWHVVDATALAPRQSLVRMATGRDAADTAFLTNHWADLILTRLTVTAVVDELPRDDVREFVQIA